MGSAILFLIDKLIDLTVFVVFASAILSWLIAFDVVNVRNPNVYRFASALDRITAPLLAPIRRVMPSLGGLDLSPIILILLLQALKIAIFSTVAEPLRAALG